jgi:hypothetical protein
MARAPARRRKYSTGDESLDRRVAELVEATAIPKRDGELITEIIVTAVLLARDAADRLDQKIINAALKEMRYAFKVFAPYRDTHKVSVFGSSRSQPGEPDYEQARAFGKAIAERGWMVVTGAGPGSMEAANEGAGKAQSFGVNIRLPFEAEANPIIAEDPKLVNFKYFFTRKLMFAKEASAFVLLPGGFGTMDEAFEVLTLMQTGKSDMHPIIFLDAPGETYWTDWLEFVRRDLVGRKYVSQTDLRLLLVTDDVSRAVEEICAFYTNYHSMRFVGEKLVIRLETMLTAERLEGLNAEFSDILNGGVIEPTDPLSVEVNDEDALDKPRLRMNFDRASYGRLRELVDRLNETG